MKRGRSLRSSVLALAFVATAVVFGLVGWAVSTWTNSSEKSWTLDAGMFGAWGSWVGGLGTAAAAGFAAFELWSARRDRRWNLEAVAMMCSLRGKAVSKDPSGFRSIAVTFSNKTSHPVTDLSVHFKGKELGAASLVFPNAQPWGFKVAVTELGLGSALPAESAAQFVNQWVRSNLVFEFTISGLRFRRHNNETLLLSHRRQKRSAD